MIKAEDFVKPAVLRGYKFWTGVPCSFLKPFINFVIQSSELKYVIASSEGEAVGIAMGMHLSGEKTVVICQNSGLGNTVNPLTSLNYPFRVPALLIITHRGAPGIKDEPQHALMGPITEDILNAMKIPWRVFPDKVEDIDEVLNEADQYMESHKLPFALIMKKGSVEPYPIKKIVKDKSVSMVQPMGKFTIQFNDRMSRLDAIKVIKSTLCGNEVVLGTTGKIGRELFSLGHSSNQIYLVGGMGCAASVGLGISLIKKNNKVIVLDGDGAVLMKMGTLATIGHYHPDNLIHVVLDNEAYESTGGQSTVSESIDIACVASACAYSNVFRCDTEETLKETVNRVLEIKGPTLIHVKVKTVSDPDLIRPDLTPIQVKEEFMRFLAQ